MIYDLLDGAIHCLNNQRQVCTPLSVACGVRNEKTVNSQSWLFKSYTVHSAIQRMNPFPVDSIRDTMHYPLDGNLCAEYHYPPFGRLLRPEIFQE